MKYLSSIEWLQGPRDRISPTIEAILHLQIRTSAASEDGTVTTRLLVPSSKVGCLLGQGGSIISEMRRRTRSDIRVYSKEDKPNYTSTNEELVQVMWSASSLCQLSQYACIFLPILFIFEFKHTSIF